MGISQGGRGGRVGRARRGGRGGRGKLTTWVSVFDDAVEAGGVVVMMMGEEEVGDVEAEGRGVVGT